MLCNPTVANFSNFGHVIKPGVYYHVTLKFEYSGGHVMFTSKFDHVTSDSWLDHVTFTSEYNHVTKTFQSAGID